MHEFLRDQNLNWIESLLSHKINNHISYVTTLKEGIYINYRENQDKNYKTRLCLKIKRLTNVFLNLSVFILGWWQRKAYLENLIIINKPHFILWLFFRKVNLIHGKNSGVASVILKSQLFRLLIELVGILALLRTLATSSCLCWLRPAVISGQRQLLQRLSSLIMWIIKIREWRRNQN